MSDFDCLIGAIEKVTGDSPGKIRNILEQAERLGWLRKPSHADNIPLDACGAKDVGFTAYVSGGE
jgi:hypothetical protein